MNSTLYTPEIREYLRTMIPKKVIYAVEEKEGALVLVFYAKNINDSLNGDEKLHLASALNEALTKIQASGIPVYIRKQESIWEVESG